MAQNVTLWGASYSNVPALNVPMTGGGTARFTDTSETTATAADVATGKIFYDSTGVQQTGTASGGGGGGASNFVQGTFTGTTTGSLDVPLAYTGSGFPIAVIIAPAEGVYSQLGGSTYSGLIQRYAVQLYCAYKNNTSDTPQYNGSTGGAMRNAANGSLRYKSSTSSATSYSNAGFGTATYIYNNTAAAIGSANMFRFRSATLMAVYIGESGAGNYHFAAGYEYKYHIIYSS